MLIMCQVVAIVGLTTVGVKDHWSHRNDPLPPTEEGSKSMMNRLLPACSGEPVKDAGIRIPGQRREPYFIYTTYPGNQIGLLDPRVPVSHFDTVTCMSSEITFFARCEFQALPSNSVLEGNFGSSQEFTYRYNVNSLVVRTSVREARTGVEIGSNEFTVAAPECITTETFAPEGSAILPSAEVEPDNYNDAILRKLAEAAVEPLMTS
ncbi:MAG TPA: hypothetical protein DEG43_14145 [Acidimicrobiaceae bacterium]|nr:hypothetical protein [Acidimicrobiaceae bacterium]